MFRGLLTSIAAWWACLSAFAALPLEAWNPVSAITTQNLANVTYANDLFVAVGVGGTILTRDSSGVWHPQTSSVTSALRALTWGNGLFVTGGGEGVLLRSTNGIDWKASQSPTDEPIFSAAFGNGTFVALTRTHALTSPDGEHWQVDPLPSSPVSSSFVIGQAVCYGAGRFVAAGDGSLLESTNGRNWQLRTQSTNHFHSVIYAINQFVAIGECEIKLGIFVPVLFSTAGGLDQGTVNLIVGTGGTAYLNTRWLNGIAYGNGNWRAVGGIHYSASPYDIGNIFGALLVPGPFDDLNPVLGGWPPDTQFHVQHLLNAVAVGAGLFVAVGDAGTIVESPKPVWLDPRLARYEAGGNFSCELQAPTGSVIRVERSADLTNWSELVTLTNVPTRFQVRDAGVGDGMMRYYRAVRSER